MHQQNKNNNPSVGKIDIEGADFSYGGYDLFNDFLNNDLSHNNILNEDFDIIQSLQP